jgi:hypothetical protein
LRIRWQRAAIHQKALHRGSDQRIELVSGGRNAAGGGSALPGDMRPLLALLGSPRPVLDTDTADRLLAGRPVPATAPPGYAEVAKLVMAASGPADPEELSGEAAAIAAFRALAHAHSPTPTSRRAAMPRKLFTVKAAAAVTVAVLSVAGVAVAATTSRSTGPAEQAAAKAASAPRGGAHSSTQGGSADANGPDATGSAMHGLCQAWQSGQGASNGGRLDSTAFQALATAAGGADKVAAYCKAAAAADGKDH